MNDLISRQAESAQPERKTEFMKLTVRNSNGKPYYSIIYLEFDDNGVGHEFEGYSSYSLDVISDYLKKFFMPSAEPDIKQQDEKFTDKEKRIFLAAMGRELEICKELDQEYSTREAYEDTLESVCRKIIRKVKGALWT